MTGPCAKYKICGALQNVGTSAWQLPRMEFVLLDEAGEVILNRNGEPVVLNTKKIQDILPESIRVFETQAVRGSALSGQPVSFQVQLAEAEAFY